MSFLAPKLSTLCIRTYILEENPSYLLAKNNKTPRFRALNANLQAEIMNESMVSSLFITETRD